MSEDYESHLGPHILYLDEWVDLVADEETDETPRGRETSGRLYVQEQALAAPSVSGGIAAATDYEAHSAAAGSYHISVLWVPGDDEVPVGDDPLQAFQVFLEDILTIRREEKSVSESRSTVVVRVTKHGAVPLPRLRFRNAEHLVKLIRVLRGYATFVEYPEDADLIHVQQSPKPRRAAASFLHLGNSFVPAHFMMGGGSKSPQAASGSNERNAAKTRSRKPTQPGRARAGQPSRRRPPPGQDSALVELRKSHLGFAILTQFAQVTKAVRNVGDIIEEGVRQLGGNNRRQDLRDASTNVEGVLFGWSENSQPDTGLPREHSARSDNDQREMPEFYKASKPRGVPVSRESFQAAFSKKSGVIRDVLTMRQAIFDGGLEPRARGLVWPFILDVYLWDLPQVDRAALLVELRREYHHLRSIWKPEMIPIVAAKTTSSHESPGVSQSVKALGTDEEEDAEFSGVDAERPLTRSASDPDGTSNSGEGQLESEPGASGSTGEMFAPEPPPDENFVLARSILGQARDGSFGDREFDLHFPSERIRDQSLQIAKDVLRTDRVVPELESDSSPLLMQMTSILMTYGVRAPHIGYCQGMSDMLTPILYAMKDEPEGEVLSFWCFTKLMDRINANFREDQSGIRAQLRKLARLMRLADRDLAAHFSKIDPDYHACFRWLLVQFKREFNFENIPRLWEVIWLDFVAERELHLYIAVSTLILHRDVILSECDSFPELLRFVNDMSMRIDPDLVLSEGTDLFYRIGPIETEFTRPLTSLRRGNSQDLAAMPGTVPFEAIDDPTAPAPSL